MRRPQTPRVRASFIERLSDALVPWVVFLSLLAGVWQGVRVHGWVSPDLLPTLRDVMARAASLLRSDAFLSHAAVTASEVTLVFVLAVPLAIALGIWIAEWSWANRILRAWVAIIYATPKSIFLPLFILAFGVNFWQKVAFGIFSTVFIVVMSTFAALESVDPKHVRVARAFGASRGQLALQVYLPSMVPVLLRTLRLAMLFNFTGILLAEMYAAHRGLGQLIVFWGSNYMLTDLLAVIFIVATVSILFNEAIRAVEAHVEDWHHEAPRRVG